MNNKHKTRQAFSTPNENINDVKLEFHYLPWCVGGGLVGEKFTKSMLISTQLLLKLKLELSLAIIMILV